MRALIEEHPREAVESFIAEKDPGLDLKGSRDVVRAVLGRLEGE